MSIKSQKSLYARNKYAQNLFQRIISKTRANLVKTSHVKLNIVTFRHGVINGLASPFMFIFNRKGITQH